MISIDGRSKQASGRGCEENERLQVGGRTTRSSLRGAFVPVGEWGPFRGWKVFTGRYFTKQAGGLFFRGNRLEPLKIPHQTTEPFPADHSFGQYNKAPVNAVSFVEAHLQPPKLMQQRQRLLDHPADYAQSAPVLGVALGDRRLDPSVAKRLAKRLAVVAAVGHHPLGREPRRPTLAANRRDRPLLQFRRTRLVATIPPSFNPAGGSHAAFRKTVWCRGRVCGGNST